MAANIAVDRTNILMRCFCNSRELSIALPGSAGPRATILWSGSTGPCWTNTSGFSGQQKWYGAGEEMQKDLDSDLHRCSRERTHQGRNMNGRVPHQAFMDGLPKSATTNRNRPRKPRDPSARQGRMCQVITISVHPRQYSTAQSLRSGLGRTV